MKIAIVGAGPTGLAASCFLQARGFNPVVFERVAEPKAIGSGLMIQPPGLACLDELGLKDQAINRCAYVNHLSGDSVSGRTIFDLSYNAVYDGAFALGAHRGVLFDLLYKRALELGVEIRTEQEIVDVVQERGEARLVNSGGELTEPFDLVVDASGVGSEIRKRQAVVVRDKLYDFGAIWGVCETEAEDIGSQHLLQRYENASIMIGLLPLGQAYSKTGRGQTAFFWSLKHREFDAWRAEPLEKWQDQVASLWPKAEPYVRQFTSHDQLTRAYYHDTMLNSYHKGRLLFLGDAAHATSPQLGQGANMGLMDARQLAMSLAQTDNLETALKHYSKVRMPQVRFYQFASHWLTPFFQSDNDLLGTIRDWTFHSMSRLPFMASQMMTTLAGIKRGVLRSLPTESYQNLKK